MFSARVLAIALLAFLTLAPARGHAQVRSITPQQADGMRIVAVRTLGTDVDAPRRLEAWLGLVSGRRYEATRIESTRRRLLAAGWLRKLDVLPGVTSPESLLVVVIAEPAPRAHVSPLLQMRADDRFVYGGKLRVWGQSGRGERMSLAVAGGGEKLLQLEWSEPKPFVSVPMMALFHADLSQETERAEDSLRFERSVVGARFDIPDHGLRLELSGSLWRVRTTDPSTLVPSDAVDRLRRGSVALVLGQPPHGFTWSSLYARVGLSATSGSAEHQDLEAQLQATASWGKRFILASGLQWRSVRGTVPRYGRVHLGSGPSLRGHAYGAANGDAGAWGGAEMRVPLNFSSRPSFDRTPLPMALTVFGDVGSAWGASAPGASTEALHLESARLRWSTGFGVVAYVRRAYPLVAELGRDDGGTWRAEFRTSLAF